jgi:multidrug efflux pump subunit AcrB
MRKQRDWLCRPIAQDKSLAYSRAVDEHRPLIGQACETPMTTLFAASLAVLLALTFLGWLAYVIASVPLSIVIAIGAILLLADFYGSMRRAEPGS